MDDPDAVFQFWRRGEQASLAEVVIEFIRSYYAHSENLSELLGWIRSDEHTRLMARMAALAGQEQGMVQGPVIPGDLPG